MKLGTVTIPAIKMTRAEENALWNTPENDRRVCGIKVKDWNSDDGHNDILLEGNDFYHVVSIIKEW